MTIERSDKAYENWRQVAEKFDYFILGVTGALCAYISQTYKPVTVGLNPGTLELIALCILVLAAVAGFKRIETTIQITLLGHRLLRVQEEKGSLVSKRTQAPLLNEATGEVITSEIADQQIKTASLTIPEIRKQLERASKTAEKSYLTRNWFILSGFTFLVFAKVWSAYV